jgi:hypothetical protein
VSVSEIQSVQPGDVYDLLRSRPGGLTAAEVKSRLEDVGANTLDMDRGLLWLKTLAKHFTNFFSLLLYVSACMCFVAQFMQPSENMAVLGWALLAVAVLNGLFAFAQEYRAERAMEELKKSLPQRVHVRRDGVEIEELAENLVPGDLLLVGEGDQIPADARLVESHELLVNNAPLTDHDAAPAAPPRRAPAFSTIDAVKLFVPWHHSGRLFAPSLLCCDRLLVGRPLLAASAARPGDGTRPREHLHAGVARYPVDLRGGPGAQRNCG